MQAPSQKKNFFEILLLESESYGNWDLEKLVDSPAELQSIPLEPLYLGLKKTPIIDVVRILPSLSTEQRDVMLDLDLWEKDELDVESFEYWIEVYNEVKDEELLAEFLTGDSFALFLKGRFNLHTFDVEDPEYPEHNNYFLTEDSLLLIEYSDGYKYADELQKLIKDIYTVLGVEGAYSYLFKIVSDTFSIRQEEFYQNKKDRLRYFGVVDYYEALEFTQGFVTITAMDNFIANKVAATGAIEAQEKNQVLNKQVVGQFQKNFDSISLELSKITNQKRQDYLQFNFTRLINGNLAVEDAVKRGGLAIGQVGKRTQSLLMLGASYILSKRTESASEALFDLFDFSDVYKVGLTLVKVPQKKVKTALRNYSFQDEAEYSFLGDYWSEFLGEGLEIPPQFSSSSREKSGPVLDVSTWKKWSHQMDLLVQLVPFINKFKETLEGLRSKGVLQDNFYLNYDVGEINFESIILSSFINWTLYGGQEFVKKMGISIDELTKFLFEFIGTNEKGMTEIQTENEKTLEDNCRKYLLSFGMGEISGAVEYLGHLIKENLTDYPLSSMKEEEFRHFGGPVILASISKTDQK